MAKTKNRAKQITDYQDIMQQAEEQRAALEKETTDALIEIANDHDFAAIIGKLQEVKTGSIPGTHNSQVIDSLTGLLNIVSRLSAIHQPVIIDAPLVKQGQEVA